MHKCQCMMTYRNPARLFLRLPTELRERSGDVTATKESSVILIFCSSSSLLHSPPVPFIFFSFLPFLSFLPIYLLPSLPLLVTMFQRAILRQSQAARSALSSRSFSTAPSAIRRPSLFHQPQLSQIARPLIRQPAYRYYSSSENKAAEENKKEDAKEGEESPAQSPEEALRKELDDKNKEVHDLKVNKNSVRKHYSKTNPFSPLNQDKYVRSVADFLNLQQRTKRDMEVARNFAIQKFAVDLLESIDNFDRALLAVPADKLSGPASEGNQELVELVTGLQMTQSVLMNSLKKHGVERFDPSEQTPEGKPQKFDPNLHEATFMTKAENMEDGDVMYAQTKGFTLNGRTLRVCHIPFANRSFILRC